MLHLLICQQDLVSLLAHHFPMILMQIFHRDLVLKLAQKHLHFLLLALVIEFAQQYALMIHGLTIIQELV
jgi:hypothetical protein